MKTLFLLFLAVCLCSCSTIFQPKSNIVKLGDVPPPYVRNAYDTVDTTQVDQHVLNLVGSQRRPLFTPIQTVTNIYVLSAADSTILLNGTNLIVALPDAGSVNGIVYVLKLIAPVPAIITNAVGSQKIDGAYSYALTNQYNAVTIQSDGQQWWCLSRFF